MAVTFPAKFQKYQIALNIIRIVILKTAIYIEDIFFKSRRFMWFEVFRNEITIAKQNS